MPGTAILPNRPDLDLRGEDLLNPGNLYTKEEIASENRLFTSNLSLAHAVGTTHSFSTGNAGGTASATNDLIIGQRILIYNLANVDEQYYLVEVVSITNATNGAFTARIIARGTTNLGTIPAANVRWSYVTVNNAFSEIATHSTEAVQITATAKTVPSGGIAIVSETEQYYNTGTATTTTLAALNVAIPSHFVRVGDGGGSTIAGDNRYDLATGILQAFYEYDTILDTSLNGADLTPADTWRSDVVRLFGAEFNASSGVGVIAETNTAAVINTNSAGQTLSEWTTAGNDADDFVATNPDGYTGFFVLSGLSSPNSTLLKSGDLFSSNGRRKLSAHNEGTDARFIADIAEHQTTDGDERVNQYSQNLEEFLNGDQQISDTDDPRHALQFTPFDQIQNPDGSAIAVGTYFIFGFDTEANPNLGYIAESELLIDTFDTDLDALNLLIDDGDVRRAVESDWVVVNDLPATSVRMQTFNVHSDSGILIYPITSDAFVPDYTLTGDITGEVSVGLLHAPVNIDTEGSSPYSFYTSQVLEFYESDTFYNNLSFPRIGNEDTRSDWRGAVEFIDGVSFNTNQTNSPTIEFETVDGTPTGASTGYIILDYTNFPDAVSGRNADIIARIKEANGRSSDGQGRVVLHNPDIETIFITSVLPDEYQLDYATGTALTALQVKVQAIGLYQDTGVAVLPIVTTTRGDLPTDNAEYIEDSNVLVAIPGFIPTTSLNINTLIQAGLLTDVIETSNRVESITFQEESETTEFPVNIWNEFSNSETYINVDLLGSSTTTQLNFTVFPTIDFATSPYTEPGAQVTLIGDDQTFITTAGGTFQQNVNTFSLLLASPTPTGAPDLPTLAEAQAIENWTLRVETEDASGTYVRLANVTARDEFEDYLNNAEEDILLTYIQENQTRRFVTIPETVTVGASNTNVQWIHLNGAYGFSDDASNIITIDFATTLLAATATRTSPPVNGQLIFRGFDFDVDELGNQIATPQSGVVNNVTSDGEVEDGEIAVWTSATTIEGQTLDELDLITWTNQELLRELSDIEIAPISGPGGSQPALEVTTDVATYAEALATDPAPDTTDWGIRFIVGASAFSDANGGPQNTANNTWNIGDYFIATIGGNKIGLIATNTGSAFPSQTTIRANFASQADGLVFLDTVIRNRIENEVVVIEAYLTEVTIATAEEVENRYYTDRLLGYEEGQTTLGEFANDFDTIGQRVADVESVRVTVPVELDDLDDVHIEGDAEFAISADEFDQAVIWDEAGTDRELNIDLASAHGVELGGEIIFYTAGTNTMIGQANITSLDRHAIAVTLTGTGDAALITAIDAITLGGSPFTGFRFITGGNFNAAIDMQYIKDAVEEGDFLQYAGQDFHNTGRPHFETPEGNHEAATKEYVDTHTFTPTHQPTYHPVEIPTDGLAGTAEATTSFASAYEGDSSSAGTQHYPFQLHGHLLSFQENTDLTAETRFEIGTHWQFDFGDGTDDTVNSTIATAIDSTDYDVDLNLTTVNFALTDAQLDVLRPLAEERDSFGTGAEYDYFYYSFYEADVDVADGHITRTDGTVILAEYFTAKTEPAFETDDNFLFTGDVRGIDFETTEGDSLLEVADHLDTLEETVHRLQFAQNSAHRSFNITNTQDDNTNTVTNVIGLWRNPIGGMNGLPFVTIDTENDPNTNFDLVATPADNVFHTNPADVFNTTNNPSIITFDQLGPFLTSWNTNLTLGIEAHVQTGTTFAVGTVWRSTIRIDMHRVSDNHRFHREAFHGDYTTDGTETSGEIIDVAIPIRWRAEGTSIDVTDGVYFIISDVHTQIISGEAGFNFLRFGTGTPRSFFEESDGDNDLVISYGENNFDSFSAPGITAEVINNVDTITIEDDAVIVSANPRIVPAPDGAPALGTYDALVANTGGTAWTEARFGSIVELNRLLNVDTIDPANDAVNITAVPNADQVVNYVDDVASLDLQFQRGGYINAWITGTATPQAAADYTVDGNTVSIAIDEYTNINGETRTWYFIDGVSLSADRATLIAGSGVWTRSNSTTVATLAAAGAFNL